MRTLAVLFAIVMISCSSLPEFRRADNAQAFLDKAAAEPGAIKTSSGLIYTELRPGTGASPKASDTVKGQLSRNADRRHGVR